jgi:capsule polysaccharide modification protein KpsS
MTGVLHFSSLARTKHNLIFKAHLRWQVFIDTQGNVRRAPLS